jgi:hypothetical protein
MALQNVATPSADVATRESPYDCNVVGEMAVMFQSSKFRLVAGVAVALMFAGYQIPASFAQEQVAAADTATAPEPLSAEELEILVARIALYPDELVAVIVAAALYPLQIIEAQRFLDDVKTKKDLQPKSDWDGSVVSLLNYPLIIKMMSDDLDWTQAMGEAITNQQKDVLVAIQQLRDKAVAEGIIKTDDKIVIVEENDNIVIQPASAEIVYVPQYEPAMLYEPNYVAAPIYYYPDPYPHYYDPGAAYFAAFVTGAVFGAVVDWDDWGVWGGHGNWGNDIDIDCNNCFNDREFNGKVNINDVDWKHVDRNKISYDKKQINKVDQKEFKNSIKSDDRNSVRNKSTDLKKSRPSTSPTKGNQVKDVRNSTLDGLKTQPTTKPAVSKPSVSKPTSVTKPAAKPDISKPTKKPNTIDRPVGKPKPAAKPDTRPKTPSPIGDVNRGKDTMLQSDRGGKSMGGGQGGGGKSQKKVKKPGKR